MTNGFNHNFTRLNEQTLFEACGFIKAMNSLYLFISEETEMKPENRHIDAVKLLDAIAVTTGNLAPLMKQYENELRNKVFHS